MFAVSPWCRRRQLNNSLPLGGGHKTRQNHLLHGNLRPNQTVLWRLVTCVGWHLRVAWQAQYLKRASYVVFSAAFCAGAFYLLVAGATFCEVFLWWCGRVFVVAFLWWRGCVFGVVFL